MYVLLCFQQTDKANKICINWQYMHRPTQYFFGTSSFCKHNQLLRIGPSGDTWKSGNCVSKTEKTRFVSWNRTNSCNFTCYTKIETLIKMASLFLKSTFVSICVVLYFTQFSSAQNDYVDFLRKANDRLTVDLLVALAGTFWIN